MRFKEVMHAGQARISVARHTQPWRRLAAEATQLKTLCAQPSRRRLFVREESSTSTTINRACLSSTRRSRRRQQRAENHLSKVLPTLTLRLCCSSSRSYGEREREREHLTSIPISAPYAQGETARLSPQTPPPPRRPSARAPHSLGNQALAGASAGALYTQAHHSMPNLAFAHACGGGDACHGEFFCAVFLGGVRALHPPGFCGGTARSPPPPRDPQP